ncbi:MAG: hypothetical protein DHS20C11_13110 [Lysobacteraceae bacterium]|nr:MAG: hypothetical protein DHS20C11_13110 [Xanthomonadaceae bacterium]
MTTSSVRLQRGFTIVELMLGLVLGVFLMLGMITLFSSVNIVYNEGQEIARLQENVRFALETMSRDIRMSSHRYCSSFNNKPGKPDLRNSPRVLVAAAIEGVPTDGSIAGIPALPNTTGTSYQLPNSYFIQGHECNFTDGDCDPVVPDYLDVPDDHGTSDGERAFGTDVLTMRYFGSEGQILAADMADPTAPVPVSSTKPNGAAVSYSNGDVLVVADCDEADIFEVSSTSGTAPVLIDFSGSGNVGSPPSLSKAYGRSEDARIFELTSTSYYIAFREDAVTGDKYSTLRRVRNGNDQELVPGVDRLDFRYGVDRRDTCPADPVTGAIISCQTAFLTAAEIEDESVGNCGSAGCLWRQVVSVEVNILMSTVNPIGSATNQPFTYMNTNFTPPDGIPRCEDDADADTCDDDNPDGLLRREFQAVISFRNMNA